MNTKVGTVSNVLPIWHTVLKDKKHAHTDALLRLPIEEKELVSNRASSQLWQIEDSLITAEQIANRTCKKLLLSKVLH